MVVYVMVVHVMELVLTDNSGSLFLSSSNASEFSYSMEGSYTH